MADKNKKDAIVEEPSFIDTVFRYTYIVLKYKLLVIIIAMVVMPLAFIVLKRRQPEFMPMYKTTARLRVIAAEGIIAEDRRQLGLEEEQLYKRAKDVSTLMQSSMILEGVVKKVYNLKEEDKDAIGSLVTKLRSTETHKGDLTVEPELNYINITAIADSPQRCLAIAENLIEVTKTEIINWQKQTVKESLASIEKELEEARHDFEEAKAKLSKFIVENKVLSEFIGVKEELKSKDMFGENDISYFDKDTENLATQLVKIRADISRKEEFLKEIETLRESSGDVGTFKLLLREKGRLLNAELLELLITQDKKLKDLLSVNREIHPDVIKAKEELNQVKISISEEVDSAVDSLSREIKALKIKEEDITSLIEQGLGNVMVEYSHLKRNVMIKQQLAGKVLDSMQKLNLASKLISSGTFVVTDPPTLPKQPFNLYQKGRTTVKYLLFSLIFGLGTGVSVGIMADYFTMTVKDITEIEEVLPFHILGEIPAYGKPAAKGERKYLLPLKQEPESVASEAFRGLRTNIKFRTMDKKINTILVTSLVPKEGKTFISANLAVAFAQTDKKVLIIDCDLRKSMMHRYFNISNKEGITQLVKGELDVKPVFEIIPNLSIMVAGKHLDNPAELLASEAFDKTLDKLKQGFDMVIIDSPPLFAVTDSNILMSKTDATLLVTRANITPKKALKRAAKMSEDVNDKILGIVFNGIEVQRGKYGSYYYYSYDYYGKKEKEGKEKT